MVTRTGYGIVGDMTRREAEEELEYIATSSETLNRAKCRDRVKIMTQLSARFASVLTAHPAASTMPAANRARAAAKRNMGAFLSKCIIK